MTKKVNTAAVAEQEVTPEEKPAVNAKVFSNDYKKYDFDTDMAAFEPLMPKLIKQVGGVGMSEYQRNFENERYDLPLCDTTYGPECLETLDVNAIDGCGCKCDLPDCGDCDCTSGQCLNPTAPEKEEGASKEQAQKEEEVKPENENKDGITVEVDGAEGDFR